MAAPCAAALRPPAANGLSWATRTTATIFSSIEGFVEKFREGFDLVMGCRLPGGGGTILPGAMPWKNRWIGNPSPVLHRPAILQMPGAGFPLRAARVHPGGLWEDGT